MNEDSFDTEAHIFIPEIFTPGDRVEFIYKKLPVQGTVVEILFNDSPVEQIVVDIDVSSNYIIFQQDSNRVTIFATQNGLHKVSPPNWY